jgi:hypothetical protein
MVMRRDFRLPNGEVHTKFSTMSQHRYSAYFRPDDGQEKPDALPDYEGAQRRMHRDYVIHELDDAILAVRRRIGLRFSSGAFGLLSVDQVREITGLEAHLAWGIASGAFDAFETSVLETVRDDFRTYLESLGSEPEVPSASPDAGPVDPDTFLGVVESCEPDGWWERLKAWFGGRL